MKYPYRFKTEQEFIDTFGSDWRRVVVYTWNDEGDMDYLLGKDLKVNGDFLSEILNQSGRNHNMLHRYDHRWLISKDMIIKNLFLPNYKPKKIIRKI